MRLCDHGRLRAALLAAATSTAAFLVLVVPASAQYYRQDNLVSDIPGLAQITDPAVKNPWGLAEGPTTPFWVANNDTQSATVYDVDGSTGAITKLPLDVAVPGDVTGEVFNPTTGFVLSDGTPALYLFDAMNGAIAGWNAAAGTQAELAATGAPGPPFYTGLAIGMRVGEPFLYAAAPMVGRVDVFDKNFTQVTVPGGFVDPNLPAGDGPHNIINYGSDLLVSYAGPTGVIDEYDTDGNLIRRFATGGTLLNPWGMVMAPASFGEFGGDLLVGNFNHGDPSTGPGYISAFDPTTGAFKGLLMDDDTGQPIALDGLWALEFGNGARGGMPGTLYFTAGINFQQDGIFGSLTPCTGPSISGVSVSPNTLWPPNHKMRLVTVSYAVTDDCDPSPVTTLSVTSSQDNDSDDYRVVDAHHVTLRAERLGNGGARTYTITITSVDRLGMTATATTMVVVPHDQGRH